MPKRRRRPCSLQHGTDGEGGVERGRKGGGGGGGEQGAIFLEETKVKLIASSAVGSSELRVGSSVPFVHGGEHRLPMLLRFAHGEAGESEARPRYVITRVTSAAVSGHAGTLAAYGQTFNATKSTPPPGFPLNCAAMTHFGQLPITPATPPGTEASDMQSLNDREIDVTNPERHVCEVRKHLRNRVKSDAVSMAIRS